ncbi:TetR/AcrR family transcriptional regulator [Verticiella sediminum]
MEQLAQALGVSRATLHRHVSSRDELVREITEAAMGACRGAFADVRLEEGPADEALQRLVSTLTPNASFYLFLRHHAGAAVCQLEEDWQRDRDRLTQFFQRGQENGTFRIDVSASWLVDALGALLHAAGEAAHEGRLAPAEMNRVVCAVLLDGARRRPSSAPSPC